jgi:hypothetical protein
MLNSTPSIVHYGAFYTSIVDNTPGREDAIFDIYTMTAGTPTLTRLSNDGVLECGSLTRLQFNDTGLTANRLFTFPDLAGKVATLNSAQTFTNQQVIQYNAGNDTI